MIPTPAGIPQGSPLSPILYILYNADLADMEKLPNLGQLTLGYIDDIAYGISGESGESNVRALQQILKETERWSQKHGAQFERSKYILIHFTRNHRKETNAGITLDDGSHIQPSDTAKYLGVIFDKKLNYRHNMEHQVKKGSRLVIAMNSIAKSTGGATFPYVKRLYTAVVKPCTQYAAIIWYTPGDKASQSGKQISTLTTVQRSAMKAMVSTFRTVPTHLLQYESQTIPVHLSLENQILKSYTRMQTTPPTNPLFQWIQRARHQGVTLRTLRTNLEYLAKQYPQYSGLGEAPPLETIYPYIVPPWWDKPYNITISADKQTAEKEHQPDMATSISNDPNRLDIYTDGSGIEGQIGAAAYSPQTSTAIQEYLGPDTTANVFTAELTAIKLATEIINSQNHENLRCNIYADSQAALKALNKPGRQSGQSIIAEIIGNTKNIKRSRPMDLTLTWIPGHVGIPGNERADAEAKKAALSKVRNQTNTQIRRLKSAQIMDINARTATLALEKPDRRRRFAISIPGCNKAGSHIYGNLSRSQTATLARLRTGHCRLNHYLHRFNIIEDPRCTCGHPKETVQHFLLECHDHNTPRHTLIARVGPRNMRVGKLLSDTRFIRDTIKYVEETKRFADNGGGPEERNDVEGNREEDEGGRGRTREEEDNERQEEPEHRASQEREGRGRRRGEGRRWRERGRERRGDGQGKGQGVEQGEGQEGRQERR